MSQEEKYTPEWINEAEVMKWLGVSRVTLFNWRRSMGLAWTSVNGKTIMYDKKQLQKLLNEKSTYQLQGLKLETA